MNISTFVCALALLLPFTATAGVTFVSSDQELNMALIDFEKEAIDSLAVSYAYYQSLPSMREKSRITGLMAHMKLRTTKGVYVYGINLDSAKVNALLDVKDGPECRPLIFVGRFRVPGDTIHTCGADNTNASDARIRARVSEIDAQIRESQKR